MAPDLVPPVPSFTSTITDALNVALATAIPDAVAAASPAVADAMIPVARGFRPPAGEITAALNDAIVAAIARTMAEAVPAAVAAVAPAVTASMAPVLVRDAIPGTSYSMPPEVLVVVRQGLALLGATLVTKGMMDDGTVQELVGFGTILLGLGWSLYNSWRKRTDAARALAVAVAVTK